MRRSGLPVLEEREYENIGEKELDVETIFQSRDDVFNLNVSLAILEAETDEVDGEFLEALTEIEGKKSFPCPNCTKVCKSKGGLTRHTNSKHREAATNLATEDTEENRLSLESLAGIVEAIKTSLITEDLYGPEINTAVMNASCTKFCLTLCCHYVRNSAARKTKTNCLKHSTDCPDSNAASMIMIEIPDRLVGFSKVCQNREEAITKPTTTSTVNLKIDQSELGPLSYVAGYIVSKLYQKYRNRKNEYDEELLAPLQSLKSTESDNNFIQARSRGGLVAPCHHLVGIVEETKICFRKMLARVNKFCEIYQLRSSVCQH